MLPASLRLTARRLGLGRALVKVHALRALTPRGALELLQTKPRVLARILNAPPIPAKNGSLELHMLLHHQRILEGIWALYSFAFFARPPCQIIVHSDGTLTTHDVARLHRVLPEAHVIAHDEANVLVESRLRDMGLERLLRFRRSLVFALKLIDPFFYGQHQTLFLLDSDVLFFRRPVELLDGLGDGQLRELPNLYSPDNGERYCLSSETLEHLLEKPCIPFFNPGVIRTDRSVLDVRRVEYYLQRPEFWSSDTRPHYYGELTLWAMLLTRAGAHRLPPTYAITPPLDGALPMSGHYCGGGYPATWFYTRALPRLARQFGV
jgi:hypothetical protein